MNMVLPHYTTWLAYAKGKALASSVFELSQKKCPASERYALTTQVRKSSRSVCANLAESYAKRRYPKHFIAKLTDSAGENYETITWLTFAKHHEYITQQEFDKQVSAAIEVAKLLNYMIAHPEKFR